MSLMLATAQLQSKDSNCYLPSCSEIAWLFLGERRKRSIIQILVGVLRFLKAGVFSGAAVGHLCIMCCEFGL